MKNKIICLSILILSLIAFATSFNKTQAYYYNSKGNSFFKEMKFQEARDEYNKSLKIKENNEVRNNIIKSLYEEKKYKEITETPSTEYFIRGNSYAFLGDEAVQQNPEEAIKNYKAALEEYKLAMKSSDDLNIKKNYEIVLKKIENLNNNQNQDKQNNKQDQNNEQDKQNQQNQQNQNSENNKQDQNNEQDKQNQQNQQNQNNENNKQDQNNEQDKQNQQNQQNQNNENNKQDQNNEQDKQNQQNQQNQNSENNKQDQNNEQDGKQNNIPQGGVQPIDSKDDGREGEVRAILKRLEGNEKQSFKNNERVINIDTGNSNNRW